MIAIKNSLSQTLHGKMVATLFCVLAAFPDLGQGTQVHAKSLGGVEYADQFPGVDIGDQINNAYAACPSTGCHIVVPPGDYSFTTPIVFGISNKAAVVDCSRGWVLQQVPTATTRLRYTGTNGAAITFNNGPAGIDGCTIQGTAHSGTTGLLLTYARASTFQNIDVSNFDIGIQVGVGAAQFFVNTFVNISAHDNLTNNLLAPSGGTPDENVVFFGGEFWSKSNSFSTSCVDLGSGVEFSFYGTSFDQCGITIRGTGTKLEMFHPHMESPNAMTASPYITLAANCNECNLTLHGGYFYENFSSAGSRTEFILNAATTGGGGQNTINLVGTVFGLNENLTQCVRAVNGTFAAQFIYFSAIQNGIGNSFQCGLIYSSQFTLGGGIYGSQLILLEYLTPGSGQSGSDWLIADSVSHGLKTSYNNGPYLLVPQIITTTFTTTASTTNVVALPGMTSTGHCSLTPTNGGAAAGIASVYISNKSTNQITVSHAATAGWVFDVICFPQ